VIEPAIGILRVTGGTAQMVFVDRFYRTTARSAASQREIYSTE
jgi:hypothetical protein